MTLPFPLMRAIVAALRRMPHGHPTNKPQSSRLAKLRTLSSKWARAIDDDARARNIAAFASFEVAGVPLALEHATVAMKRRILLRVWAPDAGLVYALNAGIVHIKFTSSMHNIDAVVRAGGAVLRTLKIVYKHVTIDCPCHMALQCLLKLPQLRALEIFSSGRPLFGCINQENAAKVAVESTALQILSFCGSAEMMQTRCRANLCAAFGERIAFR